MTPFFVQCSDGTKVPQEKHRHRDQGIILNQNALKREPPFGDSRFMQHIDNAEMPLPDIYGFLGFLVVQGSSNWHFPQPCRGA